MLGAAFRSDNQHYHSQRCHAGLISAAPGGKRNEKGGLAQASQQVEAMVKAKMARPEYIILCLEDSSDWTNATTRRLVMSVRPCPPDSAPSCNRRLCPSRPHRCAACKSRVGAGGPDAVTHGRGVHQVRHPHPAVCDCGRRGRVPAPLGVAARRGADAWRLAVLHLCALWPCRRCQGLGVPEVCLPPPLSSSRHVRAGLQVTATVPASLQCLWRCARCIWLLVCAAC